MNNLYQIHSNVDIEILEHTVNAHLADGWELVGSPFTTTETIRTGSLRSPGYQEATVYYQALSKVALPRGE